MATRNSDEEHTAVRSRADLRAARAREARSQRPWFVIVGGTGDVGKMVRLEGRIVLGRLPGCDVQIDQEGVSRQHAIVESTADGSVQIRDLDSRNGTFVNGEAVSCETLRDGDKIQIGSTTILKFSYPDDRDEASPRNLHEPASRDPRAPAVHRRGLEDALAKPCAPTRGHRRAISVVALHLDQLERVTATYSHPAAHHASAVEPSIMWVPVATESHPPPRSVWEKVEELSLPAGLREEMLPFGDRPRPGDAAQARIAVVRMVRELARDYRRAHGYTLRTDAAAIERMQRHLLLHEDELLAGSQDGRSPAPELLRHGALLGELLARRAGGVWGDLSGNEPALWQMTLGRHGETVVLPVGRVHRFLLQRNKEEDLVAFFLRLEAAAAPGR